MARPPVRYVFGPFELSTRRRELRGHGQVRPLIPRYFDLLVFLVERRADAVHRRDIFDGVWTDVIVSDSALSQAVRTLRRVLEDDSRAPRYIRTVSRHGYQFVHADVREEPDEGLGAAPGPDAAPGLAGSPEPETSAALPDALARLRQPAASDDQREEQRDLAERLHAHGPDVVAALDRMAGDGAYARALLRDARWDVTAPLDIPVAGPRDAWQLVRLRLARAGPLVATRWAAGALGAGLGGGVAGLAGGALLALSPDSTAPWTVVPVLATLGAMAGGAGGAGVGAGLALGEATWRSHRGAALVGGGALGGLTVGLAVQWLARWSLRTLVGLDLAVGGALDGLVIGAVAGGAYALATHGGGFAAPRGRARARLASVVAVGCAAAALALSLAGRPLVGGTIHLIAAASSGSQALLSPLGALVGEPGFGPVTAALFSAWEGAMFGASLAVGLTKRR